MKSRINGANVEPGVASSKAMNDRDPTSGKNGTKVGPYIQNGSHWSCFGEDQDDFGIVKQASIGTSKMDNGMESHDGWQMDNEWNQVFKMMENVRFASQLDKAHRAFEPLPGSPPNRAAELPKPMELPKSSSTIRLCSSEARVFLFPPTSRREFCNSSLTKWAPHLHASAIKIKSK